MGSTLFSWRFQKSIHPPVLRRLPCLWTHEWRVFWVSTRPMRWIFHAKHGKARDVVGFSMFMNGLGAVFGKVRMYLLSFHCCSILSTGCVCVKKWKHYFLHTLGWTESLMARLIRQIFNHWRLIIDEVCPPCRIVAGKILNVAHTFFRWNVCGLPEFLLYISIIPLIIISNKNAGHVVLWTVHQ